ncbi:MAG: hypothetical protein PHE83_17220 [Opitutaceae bacterium]|nr:hypothetical protein [Opitutaceae bacterium]
MATETPVQEFVLLPPEDPARPCWAFLGDVLGRVEHPPADRMEARNRLRVLLQEAYQERGYKLLRMALMGDGKGNLRGRVAALVESMRAEGKDVDTRMLSSADHPDCRDLLADPVWRSAINYIFSRWWSMGSGAKTIARAEAYRELDTSTNEPIKAWLPERCGVIPYLRARTLHILLEYYHQLDTEKIHMPMVSLDQYKDQYEMELSTTGDFVKARSAAPEDEEAPPSVRTQEELDQLVDRVYATTAMARPGPPAVQAELDEIRRLGREQVDARIDHYRGPATPNSPRPGTFDCWPLCVFDADFDPARTGGVEGVKQSCRALLGRLAEHDRDMATDRATLLGLLDEWDGVKPLSEHMPELFDAAWTHRYVLAGVEEPLESRGPEAAPSAVTKAMATPGTAENLLFEFMAGVNGPDSGADVGRAPTLAGSLERAYDQVRLDDLVSADLVGPDLDHAGRPDYLWLALAAGSQPARLEGEELHHEMRVLLAEYLTRLWQRTHNPRWEELGRAMAKWNPGEQFLLQPLRVACLAVVGRTQDHPAETASAMVAAPSAPVKQGQISFD